MTALPTTDTCAPPLSRREANRLERRARLLEAALTVFSRDGYAGATMDAVAAEAGLTKPTLYQYFPSKEALFSAMMLGKRDAMLAVFEHDDALDMVPALLRFAWAYADTVMRPELLALARLIIGEVQRFPEIGRAYQASGPDQVLRGVMPTWRHAEATAGSPSTRPSWPRRTCGAWCCRPRAPRRCTDPMRCPGAAHWPASFTTACGSSCAPIPPGPRPICSPWRG